MADLTETGATTGPQHAPAAAQPPAQSANGNERVRLAHAKRQVDALKGFYIHLTVFVLVIAGLFVINAATGGSWWVQWAFLGWGIGVAAHALGVFGRAPRAVADWEERKVKELANQR